jgi:hypothetical protein
LRAEVGYPGRMQIERNQFFNNEARLGKARPAAQAMEAWRFSA